MATTARPFLLSGAALVSAAALTVAAPAALPGVPTPTALSHAQYELAALSDISIEGIAEAFTTGFGGFIGAADPFYPGEFANDVLLSGINGVAYYVAAQGLDGIVPLNLDRYFFEVGSRSPGNEIYAGLGAAAYVGVGSVLGVDSVPAQFVKSLIGGGSVDIGTAIVTLTAGVPIVGDLTSVYFTGQVAGDDTAYGSGLAGVFAYVSTLLPGLAGVDFAGLVTAAAGLIGTIGDLIGGGSGNGGGNGNGNGNGGSHSDDDESDDQGDDESDDESDDADDDESDSPESDDDSNESEHQNGNGNGNGNGRNRLAAAAVAAVATPAAAVVPARAAEVTEGPADGPVQVRAEVSAEAPVSGEAPGADETPAPAKGDAGRGGSSRGAAKADSDGHGGTARAGRAGR